MKREDLFESIEKQILAEKVYRSQVKKKLGEFKILQETKAKKQVIVEKIYRSHLRRQLSSVALMIEAKKQSYVHKTLQQYKPVECLRGRL